MANITAQQVNELRKITGAGMMDCKRALVAMEGDMDKAMEYLREQGVNIAAKKASRIASEGVVNAFVDADGKCGALVELNCESDFVARNPEFVALANSIAKQVVANDPADVDALLAQNSIDDAQYTIQQCINNATAKIGEKISLRRFVRQSCSKEESYIHMGGKIGVLLEVETDKDLNGDADFNTMCHDIAMHIAALSPKYIYNSEVPEEDVAHEREIVRTQILNDPKLANKPAQIIDKMVDGKLGKFYEENCLINQEFVKNPDLTICELVNSTAKKLGASITLKKFTRFVMGEGLEKKCDNLAEEVAKEVAKFAQK